MYDVVVVGGNLAGATAAINAAHKDVKVALIEKNKKPFSPAHCGEAIPRNIADYLKLDKIECKYNSIKKVSVNILSSVYNYKLNPDWVFIIDRNYLENYLLKKAKELGVTLFLGQTVKNINPPDELILDNGKKINGKVIIDASGIACQIGRRMGLDTKLKPEDVGVCVQSRVEGNFDPDLAKIWFHKPYAPFGYAWLFPIDNKTANIGTGTFAGGKYNKDLEKFLHNYIINVTEGDYKINHTFRACVPVAKPLNQFIKNNVMIVGDAARLTNSAVGGGINNAFYSGGLAGKIAGDYLNGNINSLDFYQKSIKKLVKRLNKTYKMKNMFISEKKYVDTWMELLIIASIVNKILPRFVQAQLLKLSDMNRSMYKIW